MNIWFTKNVLCVKDSYRRIATFHERTAFSLVNCYVRQRVTYEAKSNTSKYFVYPRNYSSSSISKGLVCEQLCDRGLLRVAGKESKEFLQGLMTNDMEHLEEDRTSMFCMFLNTQGRVLYDSIIYKPKEDHVYLIECDAKALGPLERHLKLYRVRRKIDIHSVDQDMKVWNIFDPNIARTVHLEDEKSDILRTSSVAQVSHSSLNCDETLVSQFSLQKDSKALISLDPRLCTLGWRLLFSAHEDVCKINTTMTISKTPFYRHLRYRMGIGEGVTELPPGNCFPLEANCDYLHGISFMKGCYIGQELTARTYHTGVVRKRLMPLLFESKPDDKIMGSDAPIVNEKGKTVGKLRGVDGLAGIALLRISEALSSERLFVGETAETTMKPHWWPVEAPKERASSKEN